MFFAGFLCDLIAMEGINDIFLMPTALVFSFYGAKYKRCSVMQSDRQIQGSPVVGEPGGRERGRAEHVFGGVGF